MPQLLYHSSASLSDEMKNYPKIFLCHIVLWQKFLYFYLISLKNQSIGVVKSKILLGIECGSRDFDSM